MKHRTWNKHKQIYKYIILDVDIYLNMDWLGDGNCSGVGLHGRIQNKIDLLDTFGFNCCFLYLATQSTVTTYSSTTESPSQSGQSMHTLFWLYITWKDKHLPKLYISLMIIENGGHKIVLFLIAFLWLCVLIYERVIVLSQVVVQCCSELQRCKLMFVWHNTVVVTYVKYRQSSKQMVLYFHILDH